MPVSNTIKAAMTATNDIFNFEVFGKRNYDALDDVYTPDARILPPGAPIVAGRAGIKAFWKAAIESMNASAGVLSSIDVIDAGDGLVEIGKALLTVHPAPDQTAEVEVKYVVYWRNERDKWKWHIDIWNTNA